MTPETEAQLDNVLRRANRWVTAGYLTGIASILMLILALVSLLNWQNLTGGLMALASVAGSIICCRWTGRCQIQAAALMLKYDMLKQRALEQGDHDGSDQPHLA